MTCFRIHFSESGNWPLESHPVQSAAHSGQLYKKGQLLAFVFGANGWRQDRPQRALKEKDDFWVNRFLQTPNGETSNRRKEHEK